MLRRCLFVTLAWLLGACAGPERHIPYAQNWADHTGQLEKLERWQATGKLAIRSPAGSESGNLVWRQAGSQTDIFLSGPLGVAPTNMHSDGHWLEVKRGTEANTVDLNNSAEVTAATGWDFPLQALPYWIKGLPSPSLKLQRLEQDSVTGGAGVMEQAGWEVRYEQYGRFEDLNLPTKMVITDGTAKATVLIKKWRLNPPGSGHETLDIEQPGKEKPGND